MAMDIDEQCIEPNSMTVITEEEVEPVQSRICLFLKERKKAIIFRILSYPALCFDCYPVYKKYIRGDVWWTIASVFFLIVSGIIGSIYSLFREVLETSEFETPTADKKPCARPLLQVNNQDMSGIHDDIGKLPDDDSEDDIMTPENSDDVKAANKKPRLRGKVSFQDFPDDGKDLRPAKILKKQGTCAMPEILDPRDRSPEPVNGSQPPPKISTISLSQFLSHVRNCSWTMIISHLCLLSKEFHFFRTSVILWEHFKRPHHIKATEAAKENHVKEVCFKNLWNEYCKKEIVSKELSLLIATIHTVPMAIIDLLYWSVLSNEFSNNSSEKSSNDSIFEINSFSGTQFNILEMVNVLVNLLVVSYRLVSLMNQNRKIDFSREDMKFSHLLYLVLVYLLLLISRVFSIYLTAAINVNGILFVVFLLFFQFITFGLISRDFLRGSNNLTLLMSSLLMLFLYLPPKYELKISIHAYYGILLSQMFFMFVFGYFQLTGKKIITIVGHEMSKNIFYYGFACALVIFVLGIILNMKKMQKNLFLYHKHMKRKEIRQVLGDVNNQFGTNFEIIEGSFGQEKESYSVEKTVYLF